MKKKGTLYLIPTTIADSSPQRVIPEYVKEVLKPIHFFLTEDIRVTRRFLSSLSIYDSLADLQFHKLDKDTNEKDLPQLMSPLKKGSSIGLLSKSGCPCIADPGARAVQYAHQHQFNVEPLVGPSSILMALMASGLNGQQFVFHGYLPIQAQDLSRALKKMERESKMKKQTQIFIETPYRNKALFGRLIEMLHPKTLLCLAIDITGTSEMIKTQSVKNWNAMGFVPPKEPTLFLFLST